MSIKFLGGHENRLSILGCRFLLLPQVAPLRIALRSLVLGMLTIPSKLGDSRVTRILLTLDCDEGFQFQNLENH